MKTNLFNLRHNGRIGPGGWRCHCCGPAPSLRDVAARQHKRKMYRLLDRLEQE